MNNDTLAMACRWVWIIGTLSWSLEALWMRLTCWRSSWEESPSKMHSSWAKDCRWSWSQARLVLVDKFLLRYSGVPGASLGKDTTHKYYRLIYSDLSESTSWNFSSVIKGYLKRRYRFLDYLFLFFFILHPDAKEEKRVTQKYLPSGYMFLKNEIFTFWKSV